MRIGLKALAVLALLGILGTVAVTKAAGLWQTTGRRLPRPVTDPSGSVRYDPKDIKGSSWFTEIEQYYGVPLEDLDRAFGLSDAGLSPAAFRCKDMESLGLETGVPGTEIGVDSIRLFVALYTGYDYLPKPGTFLPRTARDLLVEKGGLSEAQAALLESRTAP